MTECYRCGNPCSLEQSQVIYGKTCMEVRVSATTTTYPDTQWRIRNRVSRIRVCDNCLPNEEEVVVGVNGDEYHNYGKLVGTNQ